MTLLAWESNVLYPGHPFRFPEIAYMLIHAALESFDRREAFHVERYDHLPSVRRGLVVFIEIDHIAAEHGAVQGADKQLDSSPGWHVVGAADRHVDPDHVPGKRHHGIERCRASMIALPDADPPDACALSFLDGDLCGKPHDQVPHAIVAVYESRRIGFLNRPDVGSHVYPAGSNAANVLRQAEDPMPVRSA